MIGELEILLRLGIAVLLGGLIGIERVITNHDAGLRTHILVCIGSAGIMILSELLVGDYGGEISRIGAQVVSGIGFLGAGCIIVNGNKIKGLTTAAGLWTTACIGLTIGSGYYFAGASIAVIMLVAMLILHPLSNWLQKKSMHTIENIRIVLEKEHSIHETVEKAYQCGLRIASMEIMDETVALVLESADPAATIRFIEMIDRLSVKSVNIDHCAE